MSVVSDSSRNPIKRGREGGGGLRKMPAGRERWFAGLVSLVRGMRVCVGAWDGWWVGVLGREGRGGVCDELSWGWRVGFGVG